MLEPGDDEAFVEWRQKMNDLRMGSYYIASSYMKKGLITSGVALVALMISAQLKNQDAMCIGGVLTCIAIGVAVSFFKKRKKYDDYSIMVAMFDNKHFHGALFHS